jgi:hypothetical protein
MPRHVIEGELRDSPAFERRDRFCRVPERAAVARLDLDEHQRRAVARDDVQFATTPAVAPRNYCVPASLELLAREIFARFSKLLARDCHGGPKPSNSRAKPHV